MPKKKKKRRTKESPFAGSFGMMLRQAIPTAKQRGLFLLADGNPAHPVWHIYDATGGERVLIYLPETKTWSAGPRTYGTCSTWRDALAVAERRMKLKLFGSETA